MVHRRDLGHQQQHRAQEDLAVQAGHRRDDRRGCQGAGAVLGQIAQQDMAAHRMADGQDRLRGIGRHDRVEEQFQVGDVGAEAVDVAGVVLGQGAVAQSLAPPVQRGDGKAALQQLADDLRRILLDELAAAGQQDHRAARPFRRRSRGHSAAAHSARRQPSVTVGGAIGGGEPRAGRRRERASVDRCLSCRPILTFWPRLRANSLPTSRATAIDRLGRRVVFGSPLESIRHGPCDEGFVRSDRRPRSPSASVDRRRHAGAIACLWSVWGWY